LQPQDVAYLLDYSGPDGFPQQLAQHVSQVVVLDHHKTAAEQLSDVSTHPANLAVCLDMQRSGAAIARDFFGTQGMNSSLQQIYR
jgi:oligoribonuclease NrnB/cAMP/cGMP phosphodiesterase (DHH superfamily)